jgi:sRNA-binding carbon storage regulator CsrA
MSLLLTARPNKDGPIHIINEDTGEEGTIEVVGVSGQQVRIAFNFDQNITVLRDIPYQRDRK